MMAPPGFKWVGKKGDLTLYITHIQMQPGDDEEAALYVRNENRKTPDGGCPVFMLPFKDIWRYRPEDRDRGRFDKYEDMEQELANACIALYGLDVHAYRHRIHDAILEFADDVKNEPPPPGKTAAEWEAELRRYNLKLSINGERIR